MSPKIYTTNDHLLGKDPAVVSLYEHFVELVQACGPFEYVVGKDGIAFKGQRRNIAVAKPKSRWLDGVLVLPRPLYDPRIRAAQPYTKRLFGNQFRVTKLDQLDDEFANWVREAYQVGEGQHLID
ncbi:MAG TPA: DUF5655 domain-containing protein [Anaerolineales bacterium]